jgi:hypothetical protein
VAATRSEAEWSCLIGARTAKLASGGCPIDRRGDAAWLTCRLTSGSNEGGQHSHPAPLSLATLLRECG